MYPTLILNAVTYTYVSGTGPACCNLHLHFGTKPKYGYLYCNLHVRLLHSSWILQITCTYLALELNDVTYMYISGTEPECCNLHVRVLHSRWMLLLTCRYLTLDLNDVTYMYISGAEPECCNLHVRIFH